jgi:hypothetical protein
MTCIKVRADYDIQEIVDRILTVVLTISETDPDLTTDFRNSKVSKLIRKLRREEGLDKKLS